jgi:hypothetical protein
MPRVGSAAQLGEELGPVGQLLLDHGAQHRLVDVPVHLIPVDAAEWWVGVVLDRYLDHPGGRLVGQAGDQGQAMSMPADTPAEVMNLPSSTHRLGR